MSPSFHRGADQWSSPHDRARYRAAERLAGPIDPADDAWLGGHLDHCSECRAVVDEYEQQRLDLRAHRDDAPEPPRDLWARTSAAIEREARRNGRRVATQGSTPRSSTVPLGALSAVLVVVVVVGAAILSGRPISTGPSGSNVALASNHASAVLPETTPIRITANVSYVRLGDHGGSLFNAPVREVCPKTGDPDCAPIPESSAVEVPLPSAAESVIKSPTESEIVVISSATSDKGGSVVVVPVPATSDTSASPAPIETAVSSAPASTASPTLTVSPGTDGQVEIIDQVVTDPTAAYSPDGAWFAFSARPVNGERGPDVYVVRAGQTAATPITTDHRSVFASWSDGLVIAAHPDAGNRPETVAIDPATGAATVVAHDAWRPTVDPSRQRAVYWAGTLTVDANGVASPADGQLVLGPWPGVDEGQLQSVASQDAGSAAPESSDGGVGPQASSPEAEATPPATEAPGSSAPSANPELSSPEPSSPSAETSGSPTGATVHILDAGPIVDWDARWDETGTHLAVWVADDAGGRIGHLTLYVVDPATGDLRDDPQAVKSVPSLPGFAIGKGRLAFATPPGQDAKGSRVQVQAWSGAGIGQTETVPGDTPILVVR